MLRAGGRSARFSMSCSTPTMRGAPRAARRGESARLYLYQVLKDPDVLPEAPGS